LRVLCRLKDEAKTDNILAMLKIDEYLTSEGEREIAASL